LQCRIRVHEPKNYFLLALEEDAHVFRPDFHIRKMVECPFSNHGREFVPRGTFLRREFESLQIVPHGTKRESQPP
jgi:hypothetical protein